MKNILSIFESLADENRLRIINLLVAAPELCVIDFERVLKIPQTRVSRHLAYLRNRDIVTTERKGTWVYYSLSGIFTDEPTFKSTLRSMFSKSDQCLTDIELLLEGLDDNNIAALREADEETLEFVIKNCCSLA
jgi:ArsR family transcriptional regulator